MTAIHGIYIYFGLITIVIVAAVVLYLNALSKNLMMIHRGWSHYVDRLRDELMQHHQQVIIIDFDLYDVSIFNRCEQSKDALLVIKSWDCVHPMIKVIPVEWEHTIPFGLLYSTQPSETVERFLDAVKTVI